VHLVGPGTAGHVVVAGTGTHQVQPAAGIDPVVSVGPDQHVVESTADHTSDVDQPVAALALARPRAKLTWTGPVADRNETHISSHVVMRKLARRGHGADQVVPGTEIDEGVPVLGEENGVIARAGDDGAPRVVETVAADVTYVVSFSEVDAEGGEVREVSVVSLVDSVIPGARAHYVPSGEASDHVVSAKADDDVGSPGTADPVIGPGAHDGRPPAEASELGDPPRRRIARLRHSVLRGGLRTPGAAGGKP